MFYFLSLYKMLVSTLIDMYLCLLVVSLGLCDVKMVFHGITNCTCFTLSIEHIGVVISLPL